MTTTTTDTTTTDSLGIGALIGEVMTPAETGLDTLDDPGMTGGLIGEVLPITPRELTGFAAWPITDAGLAQRCAVVLAPSWRCVDHDPRNFVHWTGKVWAPASPVEVRREVVRVIRQLGIVEPRFHDVPAEDAGAPGRFFAGLRRAFEAAETEPRSRGIVAMLAGEPRMAVRAGDFDADPYLLNTPTGMYDLRTLTCRPHDPAAMCSRMTKGSGDLAARSANFDKVLDGLALQGEDFIRCVRDLVTLGLSGFAARCWAHVTGVKDAGKSTVFELALAALGDIDDEHAPGYSASVTIDALAASKENSERPRPGLIRLARARLAFIDEATGKMLEVDLLNSVTAGVTTPMRTLNSPVLQRIRPTATIVCSGNEHLRFGDNPGVLSRLYPIHASVELPTKERGFMARLLSDQASLDALLAWALTNAPEVMARLDGDDVLAAPESVKAARATYGQEGADVVSMFIEEMLDTSNPEARQLTVGEMSRYFARYARETAPGARVSPDALERGLAARGITRPAGKTRRNVWPAEMRDNYKDRTDQDWVDRRVTRHYVGVMLDDAAWRHLTRHDKA